MQRSVLKLTLATLCSAVWLGAGCLSETEPTGPEDAQVGDGATSSGSQPVADSGSAAAEPPDNATSGRDGSTSAPGGGKVDASVGQPGQPGLAANDASAGSQPPPRTDGGLSVPPAPGAGPPPSGGPTGPRRCGTRGGVMCQGDQFCNYEPDTECGATDRGGLCEAKPEICTAIYMPVCGCDNRSYSSACDAHRAGVSVKHQGLCTFAECSAAGGKVKSSTGADIPKCAGGEEQWSLSSIEPAVCCLAKRGAGGGPKPGNGKTCGGIAGLSCEGDQFCNMELAAGGQGCEGIADAAGVCEPRPGGCTRDYRPVCGCDHRSYSNACVAHSEGVSVLRDNLCTELDCAMLGGKPVDGIGPPPMCPMGQRDLGPIRYSNGNIAIEGTICCAPR